MPWSVVFHANRQFVELAYAGVIPPADLEASITETLRVCREHATTWVLTDCSALEGGHSIVDLYDAATAVVAAGDAIGVREALILPASVKARDAAVFWETVAVNRGVQVRLFTARDEALRWLLAE